MSESTNGLPALVRGDRLAPGYRVLGLFTRNRTLDVYEAWSEVRECHCMAKVLRPDHAEDAEAQARLVREGRLLLRLTHPHIVRAYELVREPRTTVVLETLGGETLSHLIRRHRERRLTIPEVMALGSQLASALSYLHAHGVLHLDLKPGNVIAEQGRAKLLDLSLVRRPGRGVRGRGTRPYLSPEQARGGAFTASTDVWGLGSVIYRALAGVTPFPLVEGPGHPQLEGRAPSIRTLRRLPGPVAAGVDACLEPEPSERPSLTALKLVMDDYL